MRASAAVKPGLLGFVQAPSLHMAPHQHLPGLSRHLHPSLQLPVVISGCFVVAVPHSPNARTLDTERQTGQWLETVNPL